MRGAATFLFLALAAQATARGLHQTEPTSSTRGNSQYYQTMTPMETYANDRSNLYPLAVCTPRKNTTFQYAETGDIFTLLAEGMTREQNELVVYETVDSGSIGAGSTECNPATGCITRLTMINTDDMSVKWQTVTMNASDPEDSCYGCFNYPGGTVVNANGDILATSGPMVLKLDGETGEVIKKVTVPVPTGATTDIVYNGLIILPDGNIVMKNIGRPAGCPAQGYAAITGSCAQLGYGSALANATIVVLSPELEVLDTLPLDYSVAGRITAGALGDQEFIYLNGATQTRRWVYKDGSVASDDDWSYTYFTQEDIAEGEVQASAVALMKDFAVFMTNAGPSAALMTTHAISLTDSNVNLKMNPFVDVPMNASIFPLSYAAAAISVDAENNMLYPFDFAPGMIAGYRLTSAEKGFELVWQEYQPTSNFFQLIGPKDKRVIAGSRALDLPANPTMDDINNYTQESYQFRDAATGELIAETDNLGAVFGIWHSPAPGGAFYYWSLTNTIKFSYQPEDPACIAQEQALWA